MAGANGSAAVRLFGWDVQGFWPHFFPEEAEKHEGFRQEILRLSHSGLEALGGLTVLAAVSLLGAWLIIAPRHPSTPSRIIVDGSLIVLGIAEVLLARSGKLYDNARRAALAASQVTALLLVNGSLWLGTMSRAAEDFIPSQMALMSLAVVVLVPLRPVQALVNSLSVLLIYCLSAAAARRTYAPDTDIQLDYVLFMAALAALATGLAAVLHAQRRSAYFAFLETIRASADLRAMQQRLAGAEAALSTTRLAAAVSHELNTPLGALRSSVDTLLALAAKQATAPQAQMERLVRLQADLRRAIQESSARLQQISARLARFTNADEAGRQPARADELLTEVLDLIRPHLRPGLSLVSNTSPVPAVQMRAPQVSAVIHDLLNNAIAAIDAHGRIDVCCALEQGAIRLTIADTGRGIAKDRLPSIFDPGFQTSDGRVASGNWSMFNARQVIREHGGDIQISSQPGQGTTVVVTIPVRDR